LEPHVLFVWKLTALSLGYRDMGSVALLVAEYVGSFFLALYLLFFFKAPHVKFDVCVTVLLTWMFGIMGVLLLPYDLSIAIVEARTSESLGVLWETIYWVTFLLTWIVLPLQRGYHSSGYFTPSGKLVDALYRNLAFFGGMAVLLLVIGIYTMVMNPDG
jgi:hypothetical protein